MVRKNSAAKPGPQPITVRLRPADYSLLKEYAASQNTSLNAVVSEAVAQYSAKLGRQRAVDRIAAFQRCLGDSRPVGSDSVELLREMRQGRLADGAAADAPPSRAKGTGRESSQLRQEGEPR